MEKEIEIKHTLQSGSVALPLINITHTPSRAISITNFKLKALFIGQYFHLEMKIEDFNLD